MFFYIYFFFFFFNDTATTEIYTLSLHDALPISSRPAGGCDRRLLPQMPADHEPRRRQHDRRRGEEGPLQHLHVRAPVPARATPRQPPQGPEQAVRRGPEGYRRSRGAAGRRDAKASAAAAIDAAQAVHDPPRHRQDARQGSEADLMDPGRDAIDYDEIIQRYGRRLFVLAYHLTGTPALAEELCRECLVRSLLAP